MMADRQIEMRGDDAAMPSGGAARLMCVATHHKAGTIWIKRVIKSLSSAISVPWFGIWSDRRMDRVPATGRAFLCNWEGFFPAPVWRSDETAFLHVIRDPRDVLLSGCAYHQTAGPKGERFLHAARDDLGGATYQEHLNTLESPDDKLLFEMENKHADTVTQMRAWPYDDPRSVELRYEDLMGDTECAAMRDGFGALGLRGDELDAAARAFWDNSLFGGLSDAHTRDDTLRRHIASGGRLRRWEREFSRAIGEIYAERFGDDLIALGYEKDRNWVNRLAT